MAKLAAPTPWDTTVPTETGRFFSGADPLHFIYGYSNVSSLEKYNARDVFRYLNFLISAPPPSHQCLSLIRLVASGTPSFRGGGTA
jgi:hypothetical protein